MTDGEDGLRVFPVEERERVLRPLVAGEAFELRDLDGLGELLGREVRRADRADLARAHELVEGRQRLLHAACPDRARAPCTARRARARAGAGSSRSAAGSGARESPRSAPSSIGLNVFVSIVIASRTAEPFAASHSPIHVSLRPPPYASAVSNVVMPSSQAASMIRKASSCGIPCPKNAGAEPTPPKLPQPRMIRETAIPLRPSSRRVDHAASRTGVGRAVAMRASTSAPSSGPIAHTTNTPS